MLRYINAIFLGCLFFSLPVLSSAQTAKKEKPKTIQFFNGDLAAFETLLLDKEKPGFVYLYSPNGKETVAMDKMLKEPEIVQYVDSNFLAYKVDVADNPNIAVSYGIEDLPCVILIDNYRRERDRLYNYRSAADFRRFLSQVFE